GKRQASASLASIVLPLGSHTHRCLVAPSLQSGYCGENGRTPAASGCVSARVLGGHTFSPALAEPVMSTAHTPMSRHTTRHFLVAADASSEGGAAGGIGSGTALEIGGSERR